MDETVAVTHRTVLRRQKRRRKDGWGLYAAWGLDEPEPEDERLRPVVDKQLWLPPETMEDLGSPDTITVAIEPGNKLEV